MAVSGVIENYRILGKLGKLLGLNRLAELDFGKSEELPNGFFFKRAVREGKNYLHILSLNILAERDFDGFGSGNICGRNGVVKGYSLDLGPGSTVIRIINLNRGVRIADH